VALFDRDLWAHLVVERWTYDHSPLPRYPTPAADVTGVRAMPSMSYDRAAIDDLQANGTVWLLTVTASKAMKAAQTPARGAE
jgi:hypothetical protein